MQDSIPNSSLTTAQLTVNGNPGRSAIESEADQDWWRVELQAGTAYAFLQSSLNSTLDALLRVFDASGTELFADDDGGGKNNARIEFTPTLSGSYYLSAGSYPGAAVGDYIVSVVSLPLPEPAPAPPGDIAASASTQVRLPINGAAGLSAIDTPGDLDWWAVSLVANTPYRFTQTASSSSLDALLRLHNAAGTQLALNDDTGGNTDASLDFTPSTTGTYYVSAGAYADGSTGAYALGVTSLGAPPAPAPSPAPSPAPAPAPGGGLPGSTATLEPHARHIGSAMVVINGDSTWSIGTSLATAVKIQYAGFSSIEDATFGWSAVAAESNGRGGYRLFVRNDADRNAIIEVAVDASGRVDAASLALLSTAQLFAAEDLFSIDLNDSGGFGSGAVLLQGGAVNLYLNELGQYELGDGIGPARTMRLFGQALDDALLPPGWDIVEALPSASGSGWNVFAQDPNGVIYNARFDANAAFLGGDLLQGVALATFELNSGVDLDGDNNLPAPIGWTSLLKNDFIRSAVDKAIAPSTGPLQGTAWPLASALDSPVPPATITHAELVGLLKALIQSHRVANNAALTQQELIDLQALAARGKTVFAGNGPASEYLSYVFSKLVEGSEANRFFNGGSTQRSELGSLGANSPLLVLEKLVDKWLLGGDTPSPSTAGDSATGAAKSVVATYAKSAGPLFVDGISVADVVQGTAGDCYLIAAIGGLASSLPQALQAMFVDNGVVDGVRSWGVRFYAANGSAHWVTVNDMLPVTGAGSNKLAYAGAAGKDLNGEIWVPLLEKAYAQANALGILPRAESTGQNSFAAIEGGQGDPLGALVPGKVIAYTDTPGSYGKNDYLITRYVDRSDTAGRSKMEAELKAYVNAGKTVWLGVSNTLKDSFGNQLLVGSHAHFVLDADKADPNNSTVLVYNPWGLAALPEPAGAAPGNFVSPAPFTLTQLMGLPGLDFMVLDTPAG